MYQAVSKYLSENANESSYGEGYIDSMASYIQERFPGIKGFTRRGLYRMRQFYEMYAENEKVSPLVTQQTVDKVRGIAPDFSLLKGKNLIFTGFIDLFMV